jgi:uncharacterized protein YxeA
MITRKIVLLLAFAAGCTFAAQAQSRKDVKKYGIKACTESITKTENGKEVTYKDSYRSFDKSGNTTEQTEFTHDGKVRKKETARYDKDGNVLEEMSYELKDAKTGEAKDATSVSKKVSYKYNVNGQKTEESEFDGSGKLVKKTAYSYNTNGDRTGEVVYDAAGKLLKKVFYTYDKRGLKVEKKTFNGDNSLESTRKYVYEF